MDNQDSGKKNEKKSVSGVYVLFFFLLILLSILLMYELIE